MEESFEVKKVDQNEIFGENTGNDLGVELGEHKNSFEDYNISAIKDGRY